MVVEISVKQFVPELCTAQLAAQILEARKAKESTGNSFRTKPNVKND